MLLKYFGVELFAISCFLGCYFILLFFRAEARGYFFGGMGVRKGVYLADLPRLQLLFNFVDKFVF